MDYAMLADQVWDNAEILAEDILEDPDDLWGTISAISLSEAAAIFRGRPALRFADRNCPCRLCTTDPSRAHRALHRFPKKTAEIIWTKARRIRDDYGGDARKIWNGLPTHEARQRLEDMGVWLNISRMIVGALRDTGHIEGKADLKTDANVRRVLGRVFTGGSVSADKAFKIADTIIPGDSWTIDGHLFFLGQDICMAQPLCSRCCLRDKCLYAQNRARNRADDTQARMPPDAAPAEDDRGGRRRPVGVLPRGWPASGTVTSGSSLV